MRRWSKLQSALYRITDPSIRFQIEWLILSIEPHRPR